MAKWWQSPGVAQKAVIEKEKAWSNFLKHFPKADKSRVCFRTALRRETQRHCRGVFQRK